MKAQIYVNRHIVRANKKATKKIGELVDTRRDRASLPTLGQSMQKLLSLQAIAS